MSRLFYTALFALPTGIALTYFYLHDSPTKYAQYTHSGSLSHFSSFAQHVINPRRYAVQSDSVTLHIPILKLPSRPDGERIGNQEILARFTRGFFGGWAFWLEGTFFWASGYRITRVSSIASVGPQIWSRKQIPLQRLSEAGTLFFGNFLLLDHSGVTPDKRKGLFYGVEEGWERPEGNGECFVEVAFGRDDGEFSGSHRFEVWREDRKGNSVGEMEVVTVRLSSMRGNPTQDGKLKTTWLDGFHEVYAKALFRDGICEILQGNKSREC